MCYEVNRFWLLDDDPVSGAAELLHEIPGETVCERADLMSVVRYAHQRGIAPPVIAQEIVDGVDAVREHLIMEHFDTVAFLSV